MYNRIIVQTYVREITTRPPSTCNSAYLVLALTENQYSSTVFVFFARPPYETWMPAKSINIRLLNLEITLEENVFPDIQNVLQLKLQLILCWPDYFLLFSIIICTTYRETSNFYKFFAKRGFCVLTNLTFQISLLFLGIGVIQQRFWVVQGF
jgi:hypothetical protein